ncbi:ABC transporter substrate-binding protein [Ectopseudomonas oleovorans]|uniref:ABC transporter substrate-binding protein n=1 Tax=Ectopseudomonas oleovorans TaxID=301 RepID=A0AA42QFR8_ECTOL|nr:ABC transporter substrate-binding protein [Pseudomonas oleovorans]MDH1341774.1 ABC transporter substrate-binding protein [Pseudomonas oleovorans]MDH1490981.1 ABC transporter substrate-binding protein [Pseudomonas oleovorans]PZR48134.1 MAG: amino acid ABC transporter substrate-binding protein [Pseudomonas oleovorans]WGG19518.1 ABC transporter substrate-binding protein [Pseudomonas oleovorans]
MATRTPLRITALALACTLAGLFTTVHAAETPKTLSSGELKVGMEISYPPFEYYEGDQVKGFDPEISAALAKRLGLSASFSDITFPNLILGLDAGRFDTIISGMYILPERLEKADAIPYAKTGAAIMVRSDAAKKPATPEELCGLTVGLQQGTSWIPALQKVSDGYCKEQGAGAITINQYPTTAETSQSLLSGHIQAHLEIDAASLLIIEKSRGRIAISSQGSIYPQVLGIYVKKGNAQLLDALKTALDEFKASGEYAELLKKYNLEEA